MKSEQPGGQTKPGGSAQNQAPQAPPERQENKGFSQEEHPGNATPQRGAQDTGKANERPGASGAQERTQERTQERAQERTQERMGQDQDRGKAQGQAQQNGGAGRSGGANVQLSQDQRTRIKDVIVRDRNVARVDHADFNIRVGVAVPRTVHVAVLPPEVVTIVPEYRGFEYVVVGDQLLIIDPNTLEIVAILPA
jgi:hypothetical protein